MPRDSNHRFRPDHVEGNPKCEATTTRSGDACKLPAGFGTDHLGFGSCKFHGGTTPSGSMSAGAAMARSFAALYGEPIDIDPVEALLQEVRRSAGHVAWLGDQIRSMGDDDGTGDGDPRHLLLSMTEQGWKMSAFVQEYRKEREHLARVAKVAIDAGIAERHVRIAEQQGALVAGVIQSILGRLNLTPEQRTVAPAIVRGELLALSASDQQ